MRKVNSIQEYLEVNSHFAKELDLLRKIINSTELIETLQWNAPVYLLDRKKVIGLGAFNNHFSIWFFNGVFLKDDKNLLANAQEKTKGLRQMRFNSYSEINPVVILSYVKEAIENQKSGKNLESERKERTLVIPRILIDEFKNDPLFKENFNLLTPGKQRAYGEYLDDAKRDATKESRLKKIKVMISKGIENHGK